MQPRKSEALIKAALAKDARRGSDCKYNFASKDLKKKRVQKRHRSHFCHSKSSPISCMTVGLNVGQDGPLDLDLNVDGNSQDGQQDLDLGNSQDGQQDLDLGNSQDGQQDLDQQDLDLGNSQEGSSK